jgi:hypothetical protein
MKLGILNCFWLLVPILVWNVLFTPKLTQEGFKSDEKVPRWILIAEGVLRIVVFAFSIFLSLQWADRLSRAGIAVYVVGTLVYCGSWLPVIYLPEARWSTSALGALAPYFTPLVFFVGIGLIGHSWAYVLMSVLLIVFHTWHGIWSFGL